MLKIKDKYKGKKVTDRHGLLIEVNDIPTYLYKYYNETGLDYLFEEVKKSKSKPKVKAEKEDIEDVDKDKQGRD